MKVKENSLREGWGKAASAAGATRELKSVARKALKACGKWQEEGG